MRKRLLLVSILGLVAALIIVGLAALAIPSILYERRESELIEIIAAPRFHVLSEREAALRELGAMRSVRAIPYIIQLWDTPLMRRKNTLPEALAMIGEPAIPFLRQVLRGEIGTTGNAHVLAFKTCKEMGPGALPLLPEVLKWYSMEPGEEVVEAIRAIGEPESVKKVAGWSRKVKRSTTLLQRLPQGDQRVLRVLQPSTDGPAEEVKKGILLDHRWHQGPAEEKEMQP